MAAPISAIKPNKNINKSIKANNEYGNTPELLRGSAILASTSMNKNDDVFLPDETWKARNTPIDTPYNDEHEEKKIIGHITNAYVLDNEGNEYNGDETPDYFDVGVDFVLYKDIYPAIAEEVSVLGPQKRAFVSMEAVMEGFDYALVASNGDIKIVERNDSTSFLTKALRVFGGTGKYGDYRVGRVLRDFRFSGMGNVDDPANPKSIYTHICKDSDISDKSLARACLVDSCKDINSLETQEIKNMATELEIAQAKELETVKAELKTLTEAQAGVKDIYAKLQAAEKALAEKDTEIAQKIQATELANKDKELQAAEAVKAATEAKALLEAKLAVLAKKSEDDEEEKKEMKKKSEAAQLENDAYKATIDAYKSAEKGRERGNALAEIGVKPDEADLAKYTSMSDEAFAEILSFSKKYKNAAKADDYADSDDKKKKDKEAKDKKDAEAALKTAASNTSGSNDGNAANTLGNQQDNSDKLKSTASELVNALMAGKTKAAKKPIKK